MSDPGIVTILDDDNRSMKIPQPKTICSFRGEESGGEIIHNNEIWVITKSMNDFDIREWNSNKHSVIFRKQHCDTQPRCRGEFFYGF